MKSRTGVTFRTESRTGDVDRAVMQALDVASDRIGILWHGAARMAAPVDLGRLRASIAWATHRTRRQHTAAYPGGRGEPGGTVSYTPPDPGELTTAVGSNVEYALAVHEGLDNVTVQVPAHTRRITKAWGRPITPRTVQVRAHARVMNRRPMKFIEGPGRLQLWRWRDIVAEELQKLEGGP